MEKSPAALQSQVGPLVSASTELRKSRNNPIAATRPNTLALSDFWAFLSACAARVDANDGGRARTKFVEANHSPGSAGIAGTRQTGYIVTNGVRAGGFGPLDLGSSGGSHGRAAVFIASIGPNTEAIELISAHGAENYAVHAHGPGTDSDRVHWRVTEVENVRPCLQLGI